MIVGPEPQEIELVDSLNASYCVFLNASKNPCNEGTRYPCNTTGETRVYPQGNNTEWKNWCRQISHNETHHSQVLPGQGNCQLVCFLFAVIERDLEFPLGPLVVHARLVNLA